MGKIYYLIGKSASGKDSVLSALTKDPDVKAEQIVQTTTRPMREGELNGREYFFVTDEEARALEEAGRIIEKRVYHTVHGDWTYMLADHGQLDLSKKDFLAVGTVESFSKVRNYFGEDQVVPIYIYVENGERLTRALEREKKNAVPKYAELCRRFLADEADFDEAHLKEAGLLLSDGQIKNQVENIDFDTCVKTVKDMICGKDSRK